ncbi:unannotated protein [freshwater metagenome]|uniref:Unannotated protein n=1 Tax=freshwater metagenome TaxID=449393 RepID=A0A6J6URF2_9ZZZZ
MRPFPSEDATPPVTNTCLVCWEAVTEVQTISAMPSAVHGAELRDLAFRSRTTGRPLEFSDGEEFLGVCRPSLGLVEPGEHSNEFGDAIPA